MMTTALEFYEKLRRIQPDADLQPGNAFVGILQHTIEPSQPIEQDCVLWIKCPKDKEIAALLKAYRKRCCDHDEQVVLRHDFMITEEKTTVGTLATRPPYNFVALEAVRRGDVENHKNMTTVRSPLSDLTNTPSRFMKWSSPTHKDRKIPSRNSTDLPISEHMSTGSVQSRSPFGHNSRLPQSHQVSPPEGRLSEAEQVGWEDFLFEHQEAHRRGFLLWQHAHDEEFQDRWLALSEAERSWFIDRGVMIRAAVHGVSLMERRIEHWAFWCFYHDKFIAAKQAGADPHRDLQTRQGYVDDLLNIWVTKKGFSRQPWITTTSHYAVAAVERGIVDGQSLTGNADQVQGSDENALSLKQESSSFQESSESAVPKFKELLAESDLPIAVGDSPHSQDGAQVRLTMSELFDGRTPEQLEKSVEVGQDLLRSIQTTLQEQPSADSTQWIHAVENVQKLAVRSKSVVGVVGATGAGKSSVINALLDEERLVPTNCMRACTAVVTEISYNYEDGSPYRAEVEFISRDDWQKMLKILFQDLLDGTGQVSRECTNEDSESGVAYAQVKAVYPKLTKDEMEHVPIDRLMAHENVACLGTTRNIESEDALMFYKKLQHYVDSKEKSGTMEKGDKDRRRPREMEFWPLIRVVRLYVRAPALATGAVIVDLPGVHDSNQARAAVAQGYVKQCTGLWIVAPITRAVDDKSAKNLLGDSFKRQLKMDGGFNSVTFICSKTDDISITEAQDSLGLEEEMGPVWAKSEELRRKKSSLRNQIEDLKSSKSDMTAAMEAADEELEVWEKLQEDCNDGKPVFRPKPKSQKRKRADERSTSRKRPNYAEPDSDDDFVDDGDESGSDAGSDYDSSEVGASQTEPITEDEITAKIAELRGTKKARRHEKMKVDDQIKELRKLIEAVDSERDSIDAELSGKCISGRNEYSRGAIRQDYAAGIRELDQELAEEEDAANFNPDVDARDYDEVAHNLPVFCVSSRAYQKLKGRLPKDKMPPGFQHVDETEVPALQAHCIELTTTGRQASCRKFLNSMFQLLNSLRLWASDDGTGKNLTEGQRKREAQGLRDKLDKLDSALENTVNTTISGLMEELQDRVYDVYPAATEAARSQANDTTHKWGLPVNRDNRASGGLY